MSKTRCDKCKQPPVAQVTCGEPHRRPYSATICSVSYARCETHGGEKGARRSLSAHRTMFHPKDGR